MAKSEVREICWSSYLSVIMALERLAPRRSRAKPTDFGNVGG